MLEKCLGRRLCSECGKNFNVASINVKGENGNPGMSMAPLLPPTGCMSKLVARADDVESVVKERLRIYYEKVCFCSLSMLSNDKIEVFDRCDGFVLHLDVFVSVLFFQSQPVEQFYCSRGKLMVFNLPGGIPESWPKLLQALSLDDYEEKQCAAA